METFIERCEQIASNLGIEIVDIYDDSNRPNAFEDDGMLHVIEDGKRLTSLEGKMRNLTFVKTERYGAYGERAMDRHHTSTYTDDEGNLFFLDRNMSCDPPCFEITHQPIEFQQGLLPIIKIDGERYFGDGLSWKAATKIFKNAVNSLA